MLGDGRMYEYNIALVDLPLLFQFGVLQMY